MPESQVLEKLLHIPKKPGVYIFKGPKEKVLYVGKAKNLKNRIGSYFRERPSVEPRKLSMVRAVKDLSYIVTDNELEALVLEANLIKQYKPKYNVILRDDKNYPYLKITINEEWPRIEVVRKLQKDGSLYFGPYVPAGTMWEALNFIRRHFNIRPCRYRLDKPMRPCIQYQMGRCPAPCAGYISKEQYRSAVDDAIRFLRGERKELLEELQKRMESLSEEMRYEEAKEIRDRISALKHAWESQKVISPELGDIDVIGLYEAGGDVVFQVFFIRNGVMIGARDFYLKGVGSEPKKELYHGFIEMFYSKEIIPPEEIVVPRRPEGVTSLRKWLSQKRGGKVVITLAKERKREELLNMAIENARVALEGKRAGSFVLKELKERLSLPSEPHSIGAFDISTISGSDSVGAFIWWEDGEFRKDMYRHLKIKGVEGIDDYAMMSEAVKRVLDDIEPPDLIVIDGGQAHLDAAIKSIPLEKEGTLQMIAIAKDPDRVFLKTSKQIDLEDKRASSLLLKKIRDEVHRFAISFHRKLRAKRLLRSPLLDIKGIGKKRRVELLKRFGSLDAIRNASLEEIASVKGMNKKAAEALKRALGTKGHDVLKSVYETE